jgi:hypothetical protein
LWQERTQLHLKANMDHKDYIAELEQALGKDQLDRLIARLKDCDSAWYDYFAAAPAHLSHQPPAAQGLTDEDITKICTKLGVVWYVPDDSGRELWTSMVPSKLRAIVRAAVRAALSTHSQADQQAAQVVAQWQPIETAPKDGSRVVLANRQTAHTGFWGPRHYGPNWWMVSEHVAAFSTINPPTHWMPLPAAPEAAAEGKA